MKDKSQTGLVVNKISKTIGFRRKKKVLLSEVSLEVKQGQIVALLGPNGAGKTTCFSVICGLIKADSGNIYIDGKDVTLAPMYKRARMGMGYLPQETSVFRGLSVQDNILAVLEVVEPNKDFQRQELERLLEVFSITHLRYNSSLTLSGGERRRLEVARALAAKPKFILLDEPLASIDPIAVQDMRALIKQLKSIGIGILITDHNVVDTLKIAEYAYIMYEGKILTEGHSEEIMDNKIARRLYLGHSFGL
ncbi:MAG: LPS export ABC transporter ATP-binding protein [Holosporales bacterium]|jgi:lipopolysaccharide export system ATP-binding protein|nr:LPS export ABC transporter ATP-binding protein [Holosporales bacterium]